MTLVGCDLHSRKQQVAVLASLIMLLVLVIERAWRHRRWFPSPT
jgi:hypothetical protein